MGWVIGLSALVGVVVLIIARRRSERTVAEDWDVLLTPKGQEVYTNIHERVTGELRTLHGTLNQAFVTNELGSVEEAIELVQLGYRVIERFSPNMMKLLSTMATFSRMVSAMVPVEPLKPADFQLKQVVSIVYLGRVLHRVLVTAGERFRLKVYILGQGFGVAMRYLVRSMDRIVHRDSEADKEWATVSAIQEDLQTLSQESLKSFRALVVSLAAEGKGDLIQRMEAEARPQTALPSASRAHLSLVPPSGRSQS